MRVLAKHPCFRYLFFTKTRVKLKTDEIERIEGMQNYFILVDDNISNLVI